MTCSQKTLQCKLNNKAVILWILETTADTSAWETLGIPKEVQRALGDQGFTSPTSIQMLSLPPAIFHHRDIIGAAETVRLHIAPADPEKSI